MSTRRRLALAAGLLVLAAGCIRTGQSDTGKEIQDAVTASVAAENSQDTETFLALWTDDGLEAYDVGSRQELESGKSQNFGSEKVEIVRFESTRVEGDTASAVLDVTKGDTTVAAPIFRVKYELAKHDGAWKFDGFEFMGSPPAPDGVTVVNVTGKEYAFGLSSATAPANLAIAFKNEGKEHHEIALFKAPAGTTVQAAKAALETIEMPRFEETIPQGYRAAHLAFLPPGESGDVTLKEPLAAGTYVLACFIPEGGLPENGEPDPKAKSHLQLGMVSTLTVT